MKKILPIILCILLSLSIFVGCERTYTPDPAVEQFLDGGISAQKALAAVNIAKYTVTETRKSRNDDVLGVQITDVFIDLSDETAWQVTINQSANGSYLDDGKPKQSVVTIAKADQKFTHTKNEDGHVTQRDVDEQFVTEYVTTLFYHFNEAYYEGGLYYGDYYMLAIYKYPPEFFYVDETDDLCVFRQQCVTERKDTGKVQLIQETKVNRLGLLVYNNEEYISEKKDFVLVSELKATYEYKSNAQE